MTYLDHNATSSPRPELLARVAELQALALNPSSIHAQGQKARGLIERARNTIAEALECFPQELTFTASATEANNWAINAFPKRPLLVSAVEHSSVLAPAKARGAVVLPVLASGLLDMDALEAALKQYPEALVSIQLANNETGVIQPIAAIGQVVRKHSGLLHTDAVQALGKIPLNIASLGADLVTLTAHKCGGVLGAAALIARSGVVLPPMLTGGGQEQGRRAGTENVAAICGFAKAVELIDLAAMQHIETQLRAMESALQGAVVYGKDAPRLPNTSLIAMPNVPSETQLIHFDLQGISLSAGSACSSGRITTSHVLQAMGVAPELAACAVRVSAGWNTSQADIAAFSSAWRALYTKHSTTKVA